MRFDLKAYREQDGVTVLALDAPDLAAARRRAESDGYRVLSARATGRWSLRRLLAAQGFSAPLFGQELLALLEAGMSLVEAVAILAGKAKHPEARRVLDELHRVLGEGRTFSKALESVTGAFPPLLIATVRASERTGNLPEALRRWLAYHRQLNGLRDRVVAASVYPALLIGVGTLVVVFLLAYVVPRFARVYEDIGQANLPLLSRLLMHWGQAAGDHVFALVAGLCAALAGIVYALMRPQTRAALERRLWQLPTLGEQLRIYQLARFTRTVAMLLKGGVPLVSALDLTGDLLRQPALQSGLDKARASIREGRSVSEAFAAHGLATDVGVRLLVVGERGGELGEAMERIAGFYDDEVARSVDWFSRLFEPALMLMMGVMIGGIVILMYLPVFELASSIQ